jgi:hypothetical protein
MQLAPSYILADCSILLVCISSASISERGESEHESSATVCAWRCDWISGCATNSKVNKAVDIRMMSGPACKPSEHPNVQERQDSINHAAPTADTFYAAAASSTAVLQQWQLQLHGSHQLLIHLQLTQMP